MSSKNRVKREHNQEFFQQQRQLFLRLGFDREQSGYLARARIEWLRRTGRSADGTRNAEASARQG